MSQEQETAMYDQPGPRRKRVRRKRAKLPGDIWCSFGKHHSFVIPNLPYEYAGATICLKCQMQVADSLRAFVEIPELSAAMHIRTRERDAAKRVELKAERKRVDADPTSTGYVYYMRINGQIKIGYTANLRQRSQHYPPGTELLAAEPGTLELERKRHQQFMRDLARGREWFRESSVITEHIAALVERYGIPEALMYRYRKHEGAKEA